MQNPRLAARYAKSLVDLAIEQNSLDATLKDMQLLSGICHQNRDFVAMLESPVIPADKKTAVINAVLGTNIGKLTDAFAKLLVNKGREANLPEIAEAFVAQYKEMKKIRTVKLTTAATLNDNVKQAIKAKVEGQLAGNTIEMNTSVDAELIGGFVLEMDDKLFDASIRSDLDKLKSQFHDESYVVRMR